MRSVPSSLKATYLSKFVTMGTKFLRIQGRNKAPKMPPLTRWPLAESHLETTLLWSMSGYSFGIPSGRMTPTGYVSSRCMRHTQRTTLCA